MAAKINVCNVLRCLLNIYDGRPRFRLPISESERLLLGELKKVIDTCLVDPTFEVITEECLEFDETINDEVAEMDVCAAMLVDDDKFETSNDTSDPEVSMYAPSPDKRLQRTVSMEKKKKTVEFWTNGITGYRSLSSVKHRYRFIASVRQLQRYKRQVEELGTKTDKMRELSRHLLIKFENAKQENLIIHDADLRRWAIQKQNELQIDGFSASRKWIWTFKKKNRIVSRKITKFVAKCGKEVESQLVESAANFVESVKTKMRNLHPSQLLNSDQSGFNLEVHSGRTLEIAGARSVACQVQSVSATTHSYTIQPLISADGKLHSPLLVVLHENTNEFGPRVQAGLFEAPNLLVRPSKSGKLRKCDLQSWYAEAFFPNAPKNSILLVNSWSTYKDREIMTEVQPTDKRVELFVIPPKTTGMIQPLDVFYFRQWKNFVRQFGDRVLLDNLNVSLASRNNILKIQSLTHNQFASPRFENVIKYAWFKSGYVDVAPITFHTPADFCFDVVEGSCEDRCDGKCENPVFLNCGWCKGRLCFDHFFTNFYYCEYYRP